MKWTELMETQRVLDEHICETHQLKNENLFQRKLLAFGVELAELANETRCFKYWSVKPSAARDVILEEYADGLHFLLSLGLEMNQTISGASSQNVETDQVRQFLAVYRAMADLEQNVAPAQYRTLCQRYAELSEVLGFTEEEVTVAYLKKNRMNYERQRRQY